VVVVTIIPTLDFEEATIPNLISNKIIICKGPNEISTIIQCSGKG
jgi:hypothetical protein